MRRVFREPAQPVPVHTSPPVLSWIDQLQRSAGNRAVGRLLRAPAGIAVHQGSTRSAADLVDVVKKNPKVPKWVKQGIGSRGGALTAAGLKPPKGRIWDFPDTLEAASAAGNWVITTAKSKIEVRKEAGKLKFHQQVIPDLGQGQRPGSYMKTGTDEYEFSESRMESDSAEIIYGWTFPETTSGVPQQTKTAKTKPDKGKGLIVIVTEIAVTAPNGKVKTFTPGPDELAEAIIHEIGIHAGLITQGRNDQHSPTNRVVADMDEQIGEFFHPALPGGGLDTSQVTKDIFAFVNAP
jgi:hypothetical protein